METFSPEDVLIDNLSFELNKGSSYIHERRNVVFHPSGGNLHKPSSGARVLQLSLSGEDNTWLDPQSARIFCTLNNKDGMNFKNFTLYHRHMPFSDEFVLFLVVKLLKILIVMTGFITCSLN